MRKHIVLATALLGLTTTLAQANEPYFPRNEKGMLRLDTNKDGKLSASELSPVLLRRVAKMDANSDKALTAEEIDQAMLQRVQARRGRIMLLMDGDRDGKITEAEISRVLDDMFDKADTNGDGGVDLAEIKAFKRGPWRKNLIDSRGAN